MVKAGIPDIGAALDHVDPSLDFDENIHGLEKTLRISLPEPVEYEPIEALRGEMDELRLVAERMGVDIEVVESRELSRLLGVAEERERLKREVERLRREIEEKPPPPKPPPLPPLIPVAPPLKDILWDKFTAMLKVEGIDSKAHRERFEEEYSTVEKERPESQQRLVEILAMEIIREKRVKEILPRPPAVPPEEAFPVRVHVAVERTPEIVTRRSVLSGRVFVIDLDLVRRVKEVGVTTRARAEVSYRKPLLAFPEQFYQITPDERYKKFGYYDIYHALAYQVWESRSSSYKRMTLTLDDLKGLGFRDDDLAEIEKWLKEMPPLRFS